MVTDVVPLLLASSSPGRLRTLQRAGIEPRVVPPDVDEDAVIRAHGPLGPPETALLLARTKAESVPETGSLVLGCDSVLELDGWTHGKPADAGEAVKRWRTMRGRTGVLHTGHWLIDRRPHGTGKAAGTVASTTVHFAELTEAEIDAYVATGEPLKVAGAFTVDGLGAAFITRVEGDHHNVVGLSLPVLRRMLGDVGIAWHELWPSSTERSQER